MLTGGTIGAFDLLHVGHLRFLEACRARCDCLKVGVGADQTVFNSKRRRPIIGQEQRLELLAGLRCVDAVTLFDVGLDQTAATAAWIAAWPVDVMFVSQEWQASERWLRLEPALRENEIPVVWLPYTEGISTSLIRARLRDEEG